MHANEVGAIREQDLVIKQGSTFQLAVAVVDDAGVPLNLLGYTAHMQIRSHAGVDPPLVTLSTGSGLTMAANAVLVDIDGDDTAGYDWTDGFYDLFVVDGSDAAFCVLQGQVRVDRRVTVVP